MLFQMRFVRPRRHRDCPNSVGGPTARTYARRASSGPNVVMSRRTGETIADPRVPRRAFGARLLIAGLAGSWVTLAGVPGAPFVSAAPPAQAPLPAVAPSPIKRVSSMVSDASEPSVSADGRWIVFSGTVGE